MNKKAQVMELFLFFGIVLLVLFAIGDNEYKSYMRSCEWNDITRDNFTHEYNTTCYEGNIFEENRASYSCMKEKVDSEALELHCMNKYSSKGGDKE